MCSVICLLICDHISTTVQNISNIALKYTVDYHSKTYGTKTVDKNSNRQSKAIDIDSTLKHPQRSSQDDLY